MKQGSKVAALTNSPPLSRLLYDLVKKKFASLAMLLTRSDNDTMAWEVVTSGKQLHVPA